MFSPKRKPSSRYAERISWVFLVWMVIFAVVASSGGVTYAVLKNRQVAVKTEINKLQREIAICRRNTNQYRAKANVQANRWTMRSRLQRDNSALRDININQIEFSRTLRETEGMRATAAR